jgi:hypothetical protein
MNVAASSEKPNVSKDIKKALLWQRCPALTSQACSRSLRGPRDAWKAKWSGKSGGNDQKQLVLIIRANSLENFCRFVCYVIQLSREGVKA